MGFDTYISIVIGDNLLSALTIIFGIVEARKAKHISNHSRTYKYFLLIYLCVFILVTGIFFVTKNANKKKDFRQAMEQGYSQMSSLNYLDAASAFDNASKSAYNAESICEAYYCQGANYLAYAIFNNDSIFYHKAAQCFLTILEHYSHDSTEYYADAVSGLCCVYSGLEYEPTNPEYQYCINWLEGNLDFSNNNQLSHAENAQKLTAAYALGEYYMDLADRQIEPQAKSEFAAKAAQYYLAYVDFLKNDSTNTGVKNWSGGEYECFLKIADCFILMSLDCNDPSKPLNAAREIAENMLTDIPDGEYKLEFYYDIELCIAKADWVYGNLYHDEGKKEEAYERIKRVFSFQPNNTEVDDKETAYFIAIQTGLCTEEEIKTIIDFYEESINTLTESAQQKVHFLLLKLKVYREIVDKYPYTTRAVQFGENTLFELKGYYGIMSETDKELYDEFEEYFRQ